MLLMSVMTGSIWHGLLSIICAFIVCAAMVFTIRKAFPVSAELSRKLLHFSVIAILTTWLYAFDRWIITEISMAIFVAVVYLILLLLENSTLAFLSNISSERNHGEMRMSLCASGFMFMIVTAVCWGGFKERWLALTSIFAWGPGDAAAALIGRRYGKMKIGRAKEKSLEGSLAMFTLSCLCVFVILVYYAHFTLLQSLLISILTAAATATVELMILNGLDTFFCPVAAMVVLCMANRLIAK